MTDYLQQNAIRDGDFYALPIGLLRELAGRFDLDFEHGATLAVTTVSGDEIELIEATVH